MGYLEKIERRLKEQRGVIATWQMRADRVSESAIEEAARRWRRMHDGVYLSGHAPPTQWQIWKAAQLSAEGTRLGLWSAAALHGFRESDRLPTIVVRPGSGGPELFEGSPDHLGSLKVYRSNAFLDSDTVTVDGIETLSAARVLLDLQGVVRSDNARRRLVRDALRVKAVTPLELRAIIAKHHGRRGVARLRESVDLYADLPFDRTRSDAELVAAELIAAAGLPKPAVNVNVGGEEADLVYFAQKRIIELDGPQYHLFAAEDARKQRVWEGAGFHVDRLPTDDVYEQPHRLLALVPPPDTPAQR